MARSTAGLSPLTTRVDFSTLRTVGTTASQSMRSMLPLVCSTPFRAQHIPLRKYLCRLLLPSREPLSLASHSPGVGSEPCLVQVATTRALLFLLPEPRTRRGGGPVGTSSKASTFSVGRREVKRYAC